MKFISLIDKLTERINQIVEYIASFFVAVMLIVIFLQVIFRLIIRLPISWATELSTYLFIWITFLGISIAFKKHAHFAVDFFVSFLNSKIYKFVKMIVFILTLYFLLLLVKEGMALVFLTANQRSPSLRVPMSWMYLTVPISSFLMILYLIQEVAKEFKGVQKDNSLKQ